MATTPASVDKHPLHPILVAFPIGLWMFSLVCDLMHQFGHDRMWSLMAWYAMVAGLLGALAAAVPGIIDFFAITDPRAGRVALLHLAINAGLILLFGSTPGSARCLPLRPWSRSCSPSWGSRV